jgi:hypothetical protein
MFDTSGEYNPMTLEDDYRKYGAKTVELANRASTTRDKGRLLNLAERWLDLADRAHVIARRFGPAMREHPLIDAKLAKEQPEIE